MMSSKSWYVWFRILSMASPIYFWPFRMGMMMVTFGGIFPSLIDPVLRMSNAKKGLASGKASQINHLSGDKIALLPKIEIDHIGNIREISGPPDNLAIDNALDLV